MLTAKQRELLLFIDNRLKESGISPSFDEMREALDLKSKSGVHRLISALEERGFIRRLPNRARALEVLKLPEVQVRGRRSRFARPAPAAANDTMDIPLHGRIAAGTPIEALQGTENFSVPAALLGPGEHYALEVSGNSMVDEGILDGDFALIRKVDTARDGEIVVALIDNEEATLKTFRREGSMIRLDPANRQYEPQRYDPRRVADPGDGLGQGLIRPLLRMSGQGSNGPDRLCRASERDGARIDPRILRKGVRLGLHRLRPDLFGDDQRDDRRRPPGRSRRCPVGAAARDPGR